MGMTEQLENADPCKCKRLGDFDGKSHHPLCNESGKAPNYKAQRDALLDFANHIATAPQLSGTGWQEMAQMVVASAKGGE